MTTDTNETSTTATSEDLRGPDPHVGPHPQSHPLTEDGTPASPAPAHGWRGIDVTAVLEEVCPDLAAEIRVRERAATRASAEPTPYFLDREHCGRPWGDNWLRFEADMMKIGLSVREAQTPGGWGGPCVVVLRAQIFAVMGATDVELEHHSVGEFVTLYPAPIWI